MLQIRKPWTRQPQVAVRINDDLGIRPEFVFLGGQSADLARGVPWTRISGADTVRQFGRGINFSGASANAFTRSGTTTALQTKCTFVAVLERSGSNAFASICSTSSTNSSFQFGLNGVGSGLSISKGGVFTLATINLPLDVPCVVVASHNQTTGEYYCVLSPINGSGAVTRATDTNTSASTASNGTSTIHRNGGANSFNGTVGLLLASFDFLPEAKARKVLENPWQLFAPRSIWVPVSIAGGSVTGTSATTNANDTSTANGTTTIVGTSASTNASDTATASGSAGGSVTGTSATTNANDTSSAAGTTTVTGTVAYSNANDSAAASGWAGVVSGTADVTNADDTSQASGAAGGGAIDTHDGFWSREWERIRKREKKPTVAEVVEIVRESPQVVEMVRQEVEREYPQVDYSQVLANVKLQRFIARQLIEAAQEEDDIETMLLMA